MKPTRAEEILKKFSGQSVLVVGDVFIDTYIHGNVERINPEAPVPVLQAETEREMTGGAGNVAKNVVALGATATLASVCGDDELADRLEAIASKEGYTPRLIRDPGRPTIRKVRFLARSQQLLRVDYEKTHDVVPPAEDLVLDVLAEHASGAEGILVSDYAKGAVTERIAERLLALAADEQSLLGADVKPTRAPFFRGAGFVSPNLQEGYAYLGLNYHEEKRTPEELALAINQKLQTTTFLTLGAEGVYVQASDERGVHVPQTHVVEVADVSGAGDTAAAVLLLSLLAGATHVEAAELANAAGAVVVSKMGAVTASPEEILAMFTHRHA